MEFKTTNLKEIRTIAEELLAKSEECENTEERRQLDADLTEAVNYYTAVAKANCFAAAKDSGDPMKYAVREFYFGAIKVKETKDTETGAIFRSIEDCQKNIDLGELHKKLGGIGFSTKWINSAELLNYYLTIRAAERVGSSTLAALKKNKTCFKMNEISHQIELGKNPCSNTNMLKTLQGIITEMLGEGFKATSHDVNYLIDVYAQDNKKSKTGITAANHKTLRNYLKKVCYRILTGGTGYDVEQKEFKEQA